MTKKIEVYSNSALGDGDWVIIRIDGVIRFRGHDLDINSALELFELINGGESVEKFDVTNEEILALDLQP